MTSFTLLVAVAALAHPPRGEGSAGSRQGKPRICLRYGRDDQRIVQERGICLSCYNRQGEWLRGRNAKGPAASELHSALGLHGGNRGRCLHPGSNWLQSPDLCSCRSNFRQR